MLSNFPSDAHLHRTQQSLFTVSLAPSAGILKPAVSRQTDMSHRKVMAPKAGVISRPAAINMSTFNSSIVPGRTQPLQVATTPRTGVVMRASAGDSFRGVSSSFGGLSKRAAFTAGSKLRSSAIGTPKTRIGASRTQDHMNQLTAFGRGAKRSGTALFAMNEDYPSDTQPPEGNTATISGDKDTAWVDTEYRVMDKWSETIDVDKNPFVKALKLGLSVFKEKKPPTLDQLTELNKTTRDFVDENLPKFQKDPVYWAYHAARTGFFLSTGNYLAKKSGLDLYGFDSKDPNAQEKMVESYSRYIIDFFRTYEQDVENIQKGYYK